MKRMLILATVMFSMALTTNPALTQNALSFRTGFSPQSDWKSLSIVPIQTPGGPHVSSPYCTYKPGWDCCCETSLYGTACVTPEYCRSNSIQAGGGTCIEGEAGRQPC